MSYVPNGELQLCVNNVSSAEHDDQQAAAVLLRFCYADSLAGFADAPPLRAAGSLGGLSGAWFWRAATGGRERVLRRWPPHVALDQVAERHRLIGHAAAAGFNGLPRPQAASDGTTVVVLDQHCWELADWLPGEPAEEVRVDGGADLVAAGAATLADLHRVTADFPQRDASTGQPKSLAKRLQALQEVIASKPATEIPADAPLMTRQQAASLDSKLQLLAADSIRQVQSLAGQPTRLQMIHGDARREHLLFSGGNVTGVIDFGAVAYDSPMVDLARWLGETCPGEPRAWRQGVEAYNAVRPLSDHERRLAAVLAVSGALIAAHNWLRWAAGGEAPIADRSAARDRIQQVSRWVDLIADRRHAALSTP